VPESRITTSTPFDASIPVLIRNSRDPSLKPPSDDEDGIG
jgi:hypothetical protein